MIATLETQSPEQTLQYGQKLASFLKPGDIICLTGTLGAGKTLFTKGIAAGLGTDELVTSPTFSLLNIYTGKYQNDNLPIYHFDLYRLELKEHLDDIGFNESLSLGAVAIIEWPDNFWECLPSEYLLVTIELTEVNELSKRRITLSPKGRRYEELCRELTL